MKQKICILGLGYIGLPTAAMFATHGHEIIGVDVNEEVVHALNQGKIIIEEPYLDIMVQAAVTSENLTAATEPCQADVFIIAVPTPMEADKTANMKYVESATRSIVPYLEKGNIVILESTSPPGTVEELLVPILAESGLCIGEDVLVAHSPERVLPGKILMELVENNRIVGGINQRSCEAVRDLYRTFVKGEIFLTDAKTAEMCKLMENTYRDVNIALANELAKICEAMNISAWEVIELANKHPRVHLHQPGPGVGGHCLAIDPWFIIEKQPQLAQMIALGRQINDSMPRHVLERCKEILEPVEERKKVVVFGVTYKPDIDDMRESPIMEFIHLLEQEKDIDVVVVDPHVTHMPYLEKDMWKAVGNSHLIVLGVHHQVFAQIDFEHMKQEMKNPAILDTRDFWDRVTLEKLGFQYFLLGEKKEGSRL
ncbi:MAG: nucleotide sugar dehydrogenase [Epulopiscium sp.]|nr:nucleotide sugar dehydrogenase [Candidatus Epulonipiscium sp.]